MSSYCSDFDVTKLPTAKSGQVLNQETLRWEDKYKPCPFCGSKDLELDEIWQENMAMHCNICYAYGPIKKDFDGGKSAIKAWNDRNGE